jgi:NADH dehydrogenase
MINVVIAGGGFAGSATARALGDRANVTVVSQDNFLLFTPMLAEVAVGDVDPRHIVTPIRQLAPHAGLIQGTIEAIDPTARSVTVRPTFGTSTMEVAGDVLVIALGSVPNTFGIPGVGKHAVAFKDIGDALRIRNRLLALLESTATGTRASATKVAVVGAGYSGAEVAAAVADFLTAAVTTFYRSAPPPEVALIDAVERVTPGLSFSLSATAARALRERGVKLWLGSPVAAVDPTGVRLASGTMVEAGTVIWAAGIKPDPLVAALDGFTERGRIKVDGHLQAAPGLFAVGDAALVPAGDDRLSPPTAQFAIRQGRYLGKHMLDVMSGRSVRPFHYRTKGELVSLGHRNAVGRVLGIPVSGWPGWFLWRGYYLAQLPTWLRKSRVAIDWALDLIFPPDVAWLPSSDLGPV